VSIETANFVYDTQGPVFGDTLEIKDTQGNSISHIQNQPITGAVSFVITSEDLDPDNVYGDVSDINIASPSGYNHMKATCTFPSSLGYGYTCTISNIEVHITNTTVMPRAITIEASDTVGNTNTHVYSKTITYDNIGPAITSIETDKEANGISYVGPSTTFIVEFSEAGVGIDKTGILLDLSSVKSGLQPNAHECTDTACYWYNITPNNNNEGEKTISVSGHDRLNNPITGTLTASVTVDTTAPVVISSQVEGIPSGTNIPAIQESSYIKTTDSVDITTNIRETNSLDFIKVYADFSPITTTQGNVTTTGCTLQSDDTWNCEFSSNPIDVPGYINTQIPLTITDIAGNKNVYNQPIIVYNFSDETNPTYWTHTIDCSPSVVDRSITSLIEYKVMCSINLIPLTSPQETISIRILNDHCVDNIAGSTAYISSVDLINKERGSINPYLNIKLSKTDTRILDKTIR